MAHDVAWEGKLSDYLKQNEKSIYVGLNSFIYRKKNSPKTIVVNGREVCFAGMFSGDTPIKELIYPVKNRMNSKEIISYFNWVINKSPWRKAFKTKQKASVYKEEGIKMNVNNTSCYVISAMCALRHAWEYEGFIPSFNKFKKVGLSPEFSFILANFLSSKGAIALYNSNHATFSKDDLFPSTIKNFKKIEMPRFKNKALLSKKYENYGGIFTLFHPVEQEENFYYQIFDKLNKKREGGGWDQRTIIDLDDPQNIAVLKEYDK